MGPPQHILGGGGYVLLRLIFEVKNGFFVRSVQVVIKPFLSRKNIPGAVLSHRTTCGERTSNSRKNDFLIFFKLSVGGPHSMYHDRQRRGRESNGDREPAQSIYLGVRYVLYIQYLNFKRVA